MKKAIAFIAVAFAMAFTAPVFAQTTNVNTFNFAGNVVRSDHNLAFVTVTGQYVHPTVSDPLIIHFVDGYQDITCTITTDGWVGTSATPGGQHGLISVTPTGCVNTRTSAPLTSTGRLSWTYTESGTDSGTFNIVARAINVMFPGLCTYDGFTGIGTI